MDNLSIGFPNIYVNFSKANGYCYVYAYTPQYDKETKRTKKTNVKSIGIIRSKDGIGVIEFNHYFKLHFPKFRNVKVERKGVNNLEFTAIDIASTDEKEAATVSNKSKLPSLHIEPPRHMKIGASYFIQKCFENSYSGRALKQIGLSKKNLSLLTTLVIHTVAEGIKDLNSVEYYIRDHIVPYEGNINKDTIYRLFKSIDSELMINFYKKKQMLMNADLSKCNESLSNKTLIALDGSNLDANCKNIIKAKHGNSKSGNDTPIINFLTVVDQYTGTTFGHCTYSGNITDVATLEGVIKQLAYFGCSKYVLVMDRGYWCVYNVSCLYNYNVDFLIHVKTSHNSVKKLIKDNIDNLAMCNGCISITRDRETNYMMKIKKSWSYYSTTTGKKEKKPIYVYMFYNPSIYNHTLASLIEAKDEVNQIYAEYKAQLAKAIKSKKAKPAEPKLTGKNDKLVNDGVLVVDGKTNTYALDNQKATELARLEAVWVLASSIEFGDEEVYTHYAHRNQIEIGYRYLKDHIEADTLGVSTEQSFNAKLFLSLLASEFMNSFGLKVKKWNASASATERVKLKQNSFDLTMKDLDTLECIKDGDNIIPTTNLLQRHDNLFKAMGIDPIDLRNSKLKQGCLEDGFGD